MYDVESSIYMPLLEELGYMPKHRFSYGPELRQHAENIAHTWGLSNKVVFRTQVLTCDWVEERKRWAVTLRQDRGAEEKAIGMSVTAQFVVVTGGVLNHQRHRTSPESTVSRVR